MFTSAFGWWVVGLWCTVEENILVSFLFFDLPFCSFATLMAFSVILGLIGASLCLGPANGWERFTLVATFTQFIECQLWQKLHLIGALLVLSDSHLFCIRHNVRLSCCFEAKSSPSLMSLSASPFSLWSKLPATSWMVSLGTNAPSFSPVMCRFMLSATFGILTNPSLQSDQTATQKYLCSCRKYDFWRCVIHNATQVQLGAKNGSIHYQKKFCPFQNPDMQPLGWYWGPPCTCFLAYWCVFWWGGVSPTAQGALSTLPLEEV